VPADETLAKLRQHFNAELSAPTADLKGGFVC
jgi:hypothetical protein